MKAINKQRKNEFVEDDASYGQKLKNNLRPHEPQDVDYSAKI